MENFLAQLRQRQIFKVATIYVVAAWPLIQIADLAVPALGLPDSVLTLLLKVFIIGFPISLIFAWLINFTSRGLERADSGAADDALKSSGFKVNLRAFVTVAGSLVLASLLTLAIQLLVDKPEAEIEIAADPVTGSALQPLSFIGSDPRESIAVLPFDVLSQDTEDEFFVDGMVEELLNLLARMPELRVAARTSSFSYKGVSNKTINEIGTELGVDTVLEGSIRKNDVSNRIRVTAQLIEVSTGAHMWSETYDREYRDIFQIQDEIASAVADKLKVTLLGDIPKAEISVGTGSVDAMVEYGKGQKEMGHRTVPSLEKALQHFETAVAKDPGYARAYVGIADANTLLALYGSMPQEVAASTAQSALDTAFQLNDRLGAAHASQGLLYNQSHESEKAEAAYKRAIELNPNYAMAYMWYGTLMQNRGELDAAHKLFEKAFQLDPKSPVAAFNVAWGHYQLGAEEKAMEWFSKIVANDPYYPGAYLLVGNILSKSGRLDEAIDMYERALNVDPLNKNAVQGLLIANMDMESHSATLTWFDYVEDNPAIMSNSESMFLKARYYAVQGEPAKAIDTMQQIKFGPSEDKLHLFTTGEIAYYQQDYPAAISAFEQLRDLGEKNNKFFFQISGGDAAAHLAQSYRQNGQRAKADDLMVEFEQYLLNVAQRTANKSIYYYNMARVNALRDNLNEAFDFLQGAIDTGWVQIWEARLEPIFLVMAEQDRFSQMMGGVDARLAVMRIRQKDRQERELADT
ncbi:MAG: tetratricopeptide repeat protein [Arenicella sp.]|nr:tetratricopeptide repeat protein [Arenicella sp.]